MNSSYQCRFGPISLRTRMASSTEASVWLPNTQIRTMVPEARIGASRASRLPIARPRVTTVCRTCRRPMARAATAIRPVGPVASEKDATITAMAKGSIRRVAMARSTEVQVSSAPRAMAGSGRNPLL